jgi:hypothetical protein
MVEPYRARKKEKQKPFLKALERMGKITLAARAVRISRDAVHDWRRKDLNFARQFLVAKSKFDHFKARGWIVFSLHAHSRPENAPSTLAALQDLACLEQRRRGLLLGLYEPTLT